MPMPKVRGFAEKLLGGFDRFTSGPSMPGLLPEEADAAAQRHKLQMMATLLQANQPSTMPQSGMAALGGAVQDAMGAKDQYGADAIRAQLMKRELDQRLQYGAGGQDPARVSEYNFAKQNGFEGSFPEYLNQFYGRDVNESAYVKNAKYYESLTPEQRARYVESNRNIPIETINQVPTRVLADGQQQPLSTLPSEAAAAQTVSAARAEGTETGTARGTAIANLPVIKSSVRNALETVDKMLNHPGMATATGRSGLLDPRNYMPGTEARDFQALKNQAQGQVFLDAYQSLKGGGVITEVEGLKAEQAKARMDTAQSDSAYREALNDYAAALRRGLQLAEERAGGGTAAPGAPKAGDVIDGYRFKGGDPSQESSWEKQ
jgi:hypothetical protein